MSEKNYKVISVVSNDGAIDIYTETDLCTEEEAQKKMRRLGKGVEADWNNEGRDYEASETDGEYTLWDCQYNEMIIFKVV